MLSNTSVVKPGTTLKKKLATEEYSPGDVHQRK